LVFLVDDSHRGNYICDQRNGKNDNKESSHESTKITTSIAPKTSCARHTLSRQPATQTARAAPSLLRAAHQRTAAITNPTYIRNRIRRFDFDNRSRFVAYIDRLRGNFAGAA